MHDEVPLLPERARVLHIGTMKSGTSSLQRAASQRRDLLRDQGVCYPGRTLNHYSEAFAVMGARREGKVPPMATWLDLMAEVESHPTSRALVSHERICESDSAAIQRFVESMGDGLHVLVTLRPLTGMLGSFWQQQVKTGAVAQDFSTWLEGALDPSLAGSRSDLFDRHGDQGGIVQRWVDGVGADRVTVIITDKSTPTLLSRTVEQMLGLEEGTLARDGSDQGENRSLSLSEVELFRRLNIVFEDNDVPWMEYGRSYRRAAFTRVLSLPRRDDDPGIVLPTWAAERAREEGRRHAEVVAASGANVIGDLGALYAPVTSVEELPPASETISMDVAVAAIAGTVGGGLGRGPFFDHQPPPPKPAATPGPAQPQGRAPQSTGSPSSPPRPRSVLGGGRVHGLAARAARSRLLSQTATGKRVVGLGRRLLTR